MGISVKRENLTSLYELWAGIVTDLMAGSFTIVNAFKSDGLGGVNYTQTATAPANDVAKYILAPGADADPLHDTQGYRLVIEISEHFYSIWACTETQIINKSGVVRVASTGENKEAGRFAVNNSSLGAEGHFFNRNNGISSTWSVHRNTANDFDPEAVPLSCLTSSTDHGIVISTWAEGQDNAGDCFNWFVIQRPVENEVVITTGKAPLFCVFSMTGGGGHDLNTIDPEGILKFVVRESDVNVPTPPKSAVVPTADSMPIINPLQQVGIGEDHKFLLHFPQGLNTQRYSYSADLDLFAYASADVISQGSVLDVPMYSEASPRKYTSLNANSINNKGMRLLAITQGSSIPA